MEISQNQWLVKSENGTHTVELKQENYKYSNLYVDGEHIDKIKTKAYFNYEYKFEIEGRKCSLVKLVTDKSVSLVVDGEYQSKTRQYSPITNIPLLSWIYLAINFLSWLAFAINALATDMLVHYKIFAIFLYTIFMVAFSYPIRIIANSPCVIKSKARNLMLRCLLITIVEIIYSVIVTLLFVMLNY